MPRDDQALALVKDRAVSLPPNPIRRKRSPIIIGLLAIGVAFGGLGVWGATAPLASAIVANGKFVVDSKRKTVQHAEGGTISRIHVRDGDIAKAGNVLFELESGHVGASHAIARIAYFDAVISLARLRAMLSGLATISLPKFIVDAAAQDAEVESMIASHNTLLTALSNEQEGQVRLLRQRVGQLGDEIAGLEAEQASVVSQKKMADGELTTLVKLSNKGYATRDRVLAARREKTRLEGTLGRLISRIAGAQKEIGATELEILQIGIKRKRETVSELRDVEKRLFDLKEKYLDAQSRLERLKVRAPADGTIVQRRIHTVGAVIRPGDTLLEIVPTDDRLIVEARLKPQDVDNVYVGQTTEIRLTGLNQRTTAPLDGRVIYLSADSETDKQTSDPYFVVHVAIAKQDLTQVHDLDLLPGMPADISIKTGTRTAITYLMQPFFDSMHRAWKED
ncbi:MAG: HlyD family type I secretion periplasmic adaptor subunit [Hyphomicrobiaceae bacterium]